jgi:hypothetical protein
MQRCSWLLFLGVSLLGVSLVFGSACQGTPGSSPQQPEYTPTATIKDIMLSIVDPSADVVWESVATIVTGDKIEERAPRTDEEWADVRRGAIRLAEAPNLLVMPGRRVARPGEQSEAPDVELEPEEMDVLINKDRAAWSQRAKALHEAALAALQAIDAKDAQTLFEVGERIEAEAPESAEVHIEATTGIPHPVFVLIGAARIPRGPGGE